MTESIDDILEGFDFNDEEILKKAEKNFKPQIRRKYLP